MTHLDQPTEWELPESGERDMTGQYYERETGGGHTSSGRNGEKATSGDQVNIQVSGGQNQFGGRGSVFHQGGGPAVSHAPSTAQRPGHEMEGAPVSALYAFGDIVGYSRLNARLQEESQDRLTRVLDRSLAEAGVRPEMVTPQDQGDARLLSFPADTDVARVLAVMPHYVNSELLARNEDLAPHARMRIRLSFTMGPARPGKTGHAGEAPIAVVRLVNFTGFRSAMTTATQSNCGVIMDDYLYRGYVLQDFRPDMNAGEYVPVQVSIPEKGFAAAAWIRLFGCSKQQVESMVGPADWGWAQ